MTDKIFDLETLLLSHCEIKKKVYRHHYFLLLASLKLNFIKNQIKDVVCTDSRKQISKRGTKIFLDFKSPFPQKL